MFENICTQNKFLLSPIGTLTRPPALSRTLAVRAHGRARTLLVRAPSARMEEHCRPLTSSRAASPRRVLHPLRQRRRCPRVWTPNPFDSAGGHGPDALPSLVGLPPPVPPPLPAAHLCLLASMQVLLSAASNRSVVGQIFICILE
jgi:hypothetical protein